MPAPSLESTLTRAWLRRGPLACALWPLSLVFRAVSSLRALLFRAGLLRSHKLPNLGMDSGFGTDQVGQLVLDELAGAGAGR